LKRLVFVLGSFLILNACGGGIEGVADSVQITASVEKQDVQVDLRKWVDTNNDQICDSYSIGTENTQITVTVKPLPNLPNGVTPSPVKVEKIRFVYTPLDNNTPPLQAKEKFLSFTVEPGQSVTRSVEIFDKSMGDYLNNLYTGQSFTYSVQAYLYYIEINSGKRGTIKLGLNMEVADFITQDENCTPP